jgi:hypothetical protein
MTKNLPALPEAQTASDLLRHYPVVEMARTFREATAEISRLMRSIEDQSRLIRAAFTPEEGEEGHSGYYAHDFRINFEYEGRHSFDKGEEIRRLMARRVWGLFVDRIGLRNIMSVKKRNEFDEQLRKGELPEITEETILDMLMGLCGQAQDFAKEASLEVFDILRPRGHWGGQYKTNDAFRVGRKVILAWYVEQAYANAKFHVNYHHEQHITAIDGVFHLLDGKGIMRENRGPLSHAIEASPDGRGETEYFRFKCFKNRNLHLEMKRLDLVKQLNLLATGEHVLGYDAAEGD